MSYVTENEDTGIKSGRHSNILASRKSLTIQSPAPGFYAGCRELINSRAATPEKLRHLHTQIELLLILTQTQRQSLRRQQARNRDTEFTTCSGARATAGISPLY